MSRQCNIAWVQLFEDNNNNLLCRQILTLFLGINNDKREYPMFFRVLYYQYASQFFLKSNLLEVSNYLI